MAQRTVSDRMHPTVADVPIRLIDGVTVIVPDDLSQMTTYVLMEQRDWFEDEIKFARVLMQPGGRALDVGANFGAYSLSIAQVVGPAGRVWAIEPSARTAAFLERSAAANGFEHVKMIRCALSDRNGRAFLQHASSPELHSLAPDDRPQGFGNGEAVDVLTLDALAHEHDIRDVQFVKVDAEGQETRILAGATEFLQRESPLLMLELKHGQTVDLPLLDAVAAAGLSMFRLVPGLNLLVPFEPSSTIEPFRLNFFACGAQRARLLQATGFATLAPPDETAPAADEERGDFPRAAFAVGLNWSDAQRRPGGGLNLRGLHRYAQSRNLQLSGAVRVAALSQARELLGQACEQAPTIARMSSCARVCWEWGERAQAVQYLARSLESLNLNGELGLDEPFLAACPRFEAIRADEHPVEWVTACVLEQYQRLAVFSSYFAPAGLLPHLQWLASSRFASDEMRMRYALIRRHLGLSTTH